MATERPQVTVFSATSAGESAGTVTIPAVLHAPIRPDLIRYVHTNVAKNNRQAHGVSLHAGYETSAESWGTGRAVARIPRVAGGGTHRAGQGAFGNMCRGGGMFSPKKTWRRWHRRVNITSRRHAIASALAASTVPGLVMARGHRVDEVREFPVVVSDEMQAALKTKTARQMLENMGCGEDLQKVEDSWAVRSGRGKMRNRRHTCRRGPLLVYAKSDGCHYAVRALKGVDSCSVDSLSLLKLAPGGTLGRFIVWTESAIKRVGEIFGDNTAGSAAVNSYTLPRCMMTNADLGRIINSVEVQTQVKPAKTPPTAKRTLKFNPLKNKRAMAALNPAARSLRTKQFLRTTPGTRDFVFAKSKRDLSKAERKEVRKIKRVQRTAEKDELQKKIEAVAAEAAAAKGLAAAAAHQDSDDEE